MTKPRERRKCPPDVSIIITVIRALSFTLGGCCALMGGYLLLGVFLPLPAESQLAGNLVTTIGNIATGCLGYLAGVLSSTRPNEPTTAQDVNVVNPPSDPVPVEPGNQGA